MSFPSERPTLIGQIAARRAARDSVEHDLGMAYSMDELAEMFDSIPDAPPAAQALKCVVGMAWLNHPDQFNRLASAKKEA